GTTRDAIEELINIDGIPLKVIDTAGILEAEDLLTKEGVERSRFHIRAADLIIFVLDGSEPITDNDRVIIDGIKEKNVIAVVNKRDLPGALDLKEIEEVFGKSSIVEISVTKDKNINALEDAISQKVWGGEVETGHTVMVTNARHKTLLGETQSVLERTLKDADNGMPAEILSIHIKEAIESLGEITGETIDEEILNRIFGKFCIGK
ncbi:MAG: GTP-binding protein, partial [Candidatus Omnitrophota bacterium]